MPLLLPIGLGLLAFIEPCTLGATLIFVKFLEAKPLPRQVIETCGFLLVRALVIGAFGAAAALLGERLLGIQKALWIALGSLYAVIGLLYLSGRVAPLMVRVGPGFARLSGLRGSVGLGVLFGLNIPACAGPLILALLATAALHDGGVAVHGVVSLAVFGGALSLPVVAAVLIPQARGLIDRFGIWSRRMPMITGMVLVALGVWSIGFGLFVSLGHSADA